jgi:hypothetical protein
MKTKLSKSCWVNIYKYGKVEGGFNSQLQADDYHLAHQSMHDRITCIEIHWEEYEE